MRADGLNPSIPVLNSVINAFGEDRRDAEAFAVLQYMKENELKPDVVTYTTLMKALIRVEKFEKILARRNLGDRMRITKKDLDSRPLPSVRLYVFVYILVSS
ncbi:hypothetical protein Syun_015052 [Stephania yunnanensis]|uniref:Pentatricopeptide repeat-containing protein n=1 Tax=Stephania yunnanensis TaxID=152371 RepID=A0AAP0JMR9_9MAGN